MAVPDYQRLMLPVLRVAAEGVTTTPYAADKISKDIGLSEADQLEVLPSGKQRLLHNRIHWAKFYLSKAGLIDIPSRGRFTISALGNKLLDERPVEINLSILKSYPSFIEFYTQPKESKNGQSPESLQQEAADSKATPEEQIDAAHNVLQSALKADLLSRVLANSPQFFEQLVVDLLVAMGYGGSHENASRRLGRTGDGGVDGVIDEDRLGLDRIYVQAKRYAPHVTVGRPEVQGFVGSLLGVQATKGVFLTTSKFAPTAEAYTQSLQQRVILIDGSRLAALMIEYAVGIRVVRAININRVDEDFFIEE